MDRDGERVGATVEDALRAVAVMEVDIEDGDAVRLLEQALRGDARIVEEAVAEAPAPVETPEVEAAAPAPAETPAAGGPEVEAAAPVEAPAAETAPVETPAAEAPASTETPETDESAEKKAE